MLFVTKESLNTNLETVNNFIDECEKNESINVIDEESTENKTTVSKYINSMVSSCYQKSMEDIANTTVGSRLVRKRNFQQIIQESFFYGANRFGNNIIA